MPVLRPVLKQKRKSVFWRFVISLLISVSTLFIGAWHYVVPKMQKEITQQVGDQLNNAGFGDTPFVLEGRDVVLSGTVEDTSTSKELIALTTQVKGVRTVNDQLDILNPDPEVIAKAEDESKPNSDAEPKQSTEVLATAEKSADTEKSQQEQDTSTLANTSSASEADDEKAQANVADTTNADDEKILANKQDEITQASLSESNDADEEKVLANRQSNDVKPISSSDLADADDEKILTNKQDEIKSTSLSDNTDADDEKILTNKQDEIKSTSLSNNTDADEEKSLANKQDEIKLAQVSLSDNTDADEEKSLANKQDEIESAQVSLSDATNESDKATQIDDKGTQSVVNQTSTSTVEDEVPAVQNKPVSITTSVANKPAEEEPVASKATTKTIMPSSYDAILAAMEALNNGNSNSTKQQTETNTPPSKKPLQIAQLSDVNNDDNQPTTQEPEVIEQQTTQKTKPVIRSIKTNEPLRPAAEKENQAVEVGNILGVSLADITFDEDSSRLSDKTSLILTDVANQLLANEQVSPAITVYANSSELAMARAIRIRSFLIGKGVSSKRLTPRGVQMENVHDHVLIK